MGSGPSGGGGGNKKIKDVPKTVFDTTSWGGMGYNYPEDPLSMGTPGTGQGLQQPAWANTPWFDMSGWWGQQAPNVGMALMQQQGQGPYAQAPQQPAVDPAAIAAALAARQSAPPASPRKAPNDFEGVSGADSVFLKGINNRLRAFQEGQGQ